MKDFLRVCAFVCLWCAAGLMHAQSAAGTPLMGDFNGDGIPDMAIWDAAAKTWDIYLGCQGGFSPPVHWSGMWGTDGVAYAADLNGDKKTDIVMWNEASKSWSVNISTGSGFNGYRWQGMWGSDGEIHLADLNGDHKTDILMWREATKTWSVNLSTGKGFTGQSWSGAWGSDGPINVGDLNGDGKDDVFMWRDSDKVWTVNLSTGKGFKSEIWKGAWGSDGPINVGDLNGDGKADVFMWRDSDKVWTVNLSTGKGFNAEIWKGAWGSDGPINVGDLNGDGKADVFMWRDSDKVWTVNLSTGKGFTSGIWQGNSGVGRRFVRDLNKDRKADVLVWNPGDTTWSVNLSTGAGWQALHWSQQPVPPAPVITVFQVDPKPLAKGQDPVIDYSVSVPQGCDFSKTIYLTSDGSVVQNYSDPQGSVSLSGYAWPSYFQMQVVCKSPNACTPDHVANSGVLEVDGPPALKISNFSAAGGGTSSKSGSLYVPMGAPVTLSWNVIDCDAGCQINILGVAPNIGTLPTIYSLPAQGSKVISILPANTTTVWTLEAVDTGESLVTSKITITLAPLPATSPCSANSCMLYYFQISSPPDAITPECFTQEILAPDQATANQEIKNQVDADGDNGDTITTIDANQFLNNTCPLLGGNGNN